MLSVSDRRRRNQEFALKKRLIQIGIFGSSYRLSDYLEPLHRFLHDEKKLNVKLSRHIERNHPKKPDQSAASYAREISILLVNTSHIHIFLFFIPRNGERDTNVSAAMELQYRIDHIKNQYFKVYFESSFLESHATVLRGTIEDLDELNHQEFQNINDILVDSKQFCFQCIHEM